MVVLGIIAAVAVMVIPKIDDKNNKLKREIRRLSVLSHQIRYFAKLKNSTFRLVIDMKSGANALDSQQYWLERANGEVLMDADREEYMKKIDDAQKEAEEKADDEIAKSKIVAHAKDFEVDNSILKEMKTLPSGLIFESIELDGVESPLKEGKVYINFYPSGLVDETAIHLKMGANQWTLAIHPLTGKAEIASKFIALRDIKDQ